MPDVLIQTYNEELNLPRTLESVVGWANKIFIVDSGSTDATRTIAHAAGATFVHHDWEGYAAQKNWALDNLPWESEWILIIDADEAVTPELREEIAAITARAPSDVRESGFYLNRMLIFMGRRIRHCGYFPSWNLRLFKRGKARYEERLVHEHMIVDGATGKLRNLLMHEDRRGLEHFVAKHNRYSTLEAREIYESPEKWCGFAHFFSNGIQRRRFIKTRITPHLPVAWVWRFLYMYVVRLGILDGRGGWHLCSFIASYELSTQLKLAELKRLNGARTAGASGLSVPEGCGGLAELSEARPIESLAAGTASGTAARTAARRAATRNHVRPSASDLPADHDYGVPTLLHDHRDRVKFSSPWSLKQNIARAAWMLTWKMIFRPSFHNWYGFRNAILRAFGAQIGKQVRIRPTAKIEIPWNLDIGDYSVIGDDAIIYSLGKITIGQRVVVSQYAHLCAGTHDFRYRSFPLLKPPITIGSDAWIASDSFVGPGVVVGQGAVLGARSSAFDDLPAFKVCVGSPAKAIKDRVMFDWDPALMKTDPVERDPASDAEPTPALGAIREGDVAEPQA